MGIWCPQPITAVRDGVWVYVTSSLNRKCKDDIVQMNLPCKSKCCDSIFHVSPQSYELGSELHSAYF